MLRAAESEASLGAQGATGASAAAASGARPSDSYAAGVLDAGTADYADSDEEPLANLVKRSTAAGKGRKREASSSPKARPRQVQKCYERVDARTGRGDSWRAREAEARVAAKRVSGPQSDGRTGPSEYGRRVAARIQRGQGPQLFMPDDVAEGQAEGALRHRPQWLGEHAAIPYGCDRCGARSRWPEELLASFCRGQPQAVEEAHASHRLMILGSIVFCDRCGARSTGGMSVLLKEACNSEPADKNAKTRRNNMRKGKDPIIPSIFHGVPIQVVKARDPIALDGGEGAAGLGLGPGGCRGGSSGAIGRSHAARASGGAAGAGEAGEDGHPSSAAVTAATMIVFLDSTRVQ